MKETFDVLKKSAEAVKHYQEFIERLQQQSFDIQTFLEAAQYLDLDNLEDTIADLKTTVSNHNVAEIFKSFTEDMNIFLNNIQDL